MPERQPVGVIYRERELHRGGGRGFARRARSHWLFGGTVCSHPSTPACTPMLCLRRRHVHDASVSRGGYRYKMILEEDRVRPAACACVVRKTGRRERALWAIRARKAGRPLRQETRAPRPDDQPRFMRNRRRVHYTLGLAVDATTTLESRGRHHLVV